MWEVEFTDEFGDWWDSLTEDEQESLTVSVKLLQVLGPALGRPHADTVKKSRPQQHEGTQNPVPRTADQNILCL